MEEESTQTGHSSKYPDNIVLELPRKEIVASFEMKWTETPMIQQLLQEKMQIRDSKFSVDEMKKFLYSSRLLTKIETISMNLQLGN